MQIVYLVVSLAIVCEGTILSVIEACRHGARAAIYSYPWDQAYWSQGLGELTQEGMRQHYLNGVEFRRRYIIEQQVLPPTFNHSTIYVQSTDVNRTIMSAESQLMGLYPVGPSLSSVAMETKAVPPFNISNLNNIIAELGMQALPNYFQPVPVHVVDQDYDFIMLASDNCPYIDYIQASVKKSAYYQYLLTNYSMSLQNQLYRAFQTEINFGGAGHIGDTLVCDTFHGYEMPPGVTQEMYQQMTWIMNYSNWYYYQNGGAYLASSQFFANMLNVFDGNINGTSTMKFQLFSGHDTTLVGYLTALGQWDMNNPPFASTMIFELHDEGGQYFVKSLYNDVPMNISNCAEMCPYDEFKAFLTSWIVPNVEEVCQTTPDIAFLGIKEEEEEYFSKAT